MNLMDFKQEECTNAHCEVIASRAIGVEKDLEFAECALRRMLVRFGQLHPGLPEIACLDLECDGHDSKECHGHTTTCTTVRTSGRAPSSTSVEEDAAFEDLSNNGVLGLAFDDSLCLMTMVECSPASDCGLLQVGDRLCSYNSIPITQLLRGAGSGGGTQEKKEEKLGEEEAGQREGDRSEEIGALKALQRELQGPIGSSVHFVFERTISGETAGEASGAAAGAADGALKVLINVRLVRDSSKRVLNRIERRVLWRRLETSMQHACTLTETNADKATDIERERERERERCGAAPTCMQQMTVEQLQHQLHRLHECNAHLLTNLQMSLQLNLKLQSTNTHNHVRVVRNQEEATASLAVSPRGNTHAPPIRAFVKDLGRVVAWRLQSIEKFLTRLSKGAISDCPTATHPATEGFV